MTNHRIQIAAKPMGSFALRSAFADVPEYTHTLFMCAEAVPIYCKALELYGHTPQGEFLAFDERVGAAMQKEGLSPFLISNLALLDLDDAYLFIPAAPWLHPSLAQNLRVRQVRHQMCPLYDVVEGVSQAVDTKVLKTLSETRVLPDGAR